MHPPLGAKGHNPKCKEAIEALQQCHKDAGVVGRMTGMCNDAKREIDHCFRTNKNVDRKEHLTEAREARERWRRACDELNLPSTAAAPARPS